MVWIPNLKQMKNREIEHRSAVGFRAVQDGVNGSVATGSAAMGQASPPTNRSAQKRGEAPLLRGWIQKQ